MQLDFGRIRKVHLRYRRRKSTARELEEAARQYAEAFRKWWSTCLCPESLRKLGDFHPRYVEWENRNYHAEVEKNTLSDILLLVARARVTKLTRHDP